RVLHTAVWTGDAMIVWGGEEVDDCYGPLPCYPFSIGSGRRYDPVTDQWTPISHRNTPSMRYEHTAVWTGSLMIVWGGEGGYYGGFLNDGERYDPRADAWTPTSTTRAPASGFEHTAIWTGSFMIVWGAVFDAFENSYMG